MYPSKSLLILLCAGVLCAQVPIGVDGFVGTTPSPSPVPGAVVGSIDYFNLSPSNAWSGFAGDTWRFTSWGNNSLLSLFPNASGLPVFGTPNDGAIASGCSYAGSVGMVQLSKLPDAFTAATTSNTLITAYTNCALTADNGWSQSLTTPYCTSCLGTWKGGDAIFVDNRLFVNLYRQDSPGTIWGDSTLFMSPDAGQHWIDFEHYFTFTITAASCSSGTVTLTATNTSTVGDIVYVHDLGTGWDGKWTLTAATGSSVQYAATCPGSAAVITAESAYGTMKAFIDAPDGPNLAGYSAGNGSMMWPGSPNQMTFLEFIHFGQDGNWDIPIDSGCDPRTYLCGYSFKQNTSAGNAGFSPTILWRVPRGHEFTKSQYQFYTCSGYNPLWPDPTSVCDGNLSGNWTSNGATGLASATNVRNNADGGAVYPGDCMSVKYLSPHKSYAFVCSTYMDVSRGLGRYAFLSAPHPWGPFYPVFAFSDTLVLPHNSWEGLMGYGETIVSSTPPKTQTHISGVVFPPPSAQGTANTSGTAVTCVTNCVFDSTWVGRNFQAGSGPTDTTVATVTDASHLTTAASVGTSSGSTWKYAIHPPGDSPAFTTVQFSAGRVLFPVGYARNGFAQNLATLGMGHRFSMAPQRGAIPLRGKAADGSVYALDWFADIYDHGGRVAGNYASRPFFRDLVSNGVRYFSVKDSSNPGYNTNLTLTTSGVRDYSTLSDTSRLEGTWNDSTMAGNASYTMFSVFQVEGADGLGSWAVSNNENSAPIIYVGAVGSSVTPGTAATMSLSSYHLSVDTIGGIAAPMGDLCWRTGGFEGYGAPTNQVGYCTVSTYSNVAASSNTVITSTSKWYFGAISVKASGSGNPIVTINLCSGGTCTEYGGGGCDLHASASGANCNGLWKWCNGTGCTQTPAVSSSTTISLGYNPEAGGRTIVGTLGESGVYSGVVPTNVITDIYRTLRDDWLRTGRGAL